MFILKGLLLTMYKMYFNRGGTFKDYIFQGTRLLTSPVLLRRQRTEKWIGKLVSKPYSKWSNYSVLSNKKLTVGFTRSVLIGPH